MSVYLHLKHGKKSQICPISFWPVLLWWTCSLYSTTMGGSETAFLVKCGNKDLPQVARERQKTKRQGRKTGGGEGGQGVGAGHRQRNILPHMWVLTNSYPPSFWAAWNIVQRLTVGNTRQTRQSGTLGKNLSGDIWCHMVMTVKANTVLDIVFRFFT